MQFVAEQSKLVDGLNRVIGAVEKKTTMPILGCVLVDADISGVTLTASDMEIALTTRIDASVKEGGKVAIPGPAFQGYIAKLSGEVGVKITPAMRAAISAGSSRSNIASMKGDEFPEMPKPQGERKSKLDGKELARIIAQTEYVIEQGSTMSQIPGALFRIEGETITACTTNGHRLAVSSAKCEKGEDCHFVLSQRSVSQLRRMVEGGGDVDVYVHQSEAVFVHGDDVFSSRTLDLRFPDVNRIMGQAVTASMTVSKRELAAALDRITPFSVNQKTLAVDIDAADGVLKLSGENAELGQAEESLKATVDGTIRERFNPNYLLGPLRHCGDSVKIELAGKSMFRIQTDEFTYIVSGMARPKV